MTRQKFIYEVTVYNGVLTASINLTLKRPAQPNLYTENTVKWKKETDYTLKSCEKYIFQLPTNYIWRKNIFKIMKILGS